MPEHDDWDQHWDRYAVAASRNPAQQMRHALITKLLLHEVTGSPARILDIGSGQGDLMAKLRPLLPQATLLGFELSKSGVAISRKKVPDAAFVAADLFQPPAEFENYKNWATDAICSEVLEHVDSPTAFLQAVRPYLADSARLIVTVPGGPMSAFDHHIGHRQHFTRNSIGLVLQEAGFTVERVYLSGFPFFNLYRRVVIARGEKLAADVDGDYRGFSARLAAAVMAVFRGLFRLNLMDSPFGWQVVAVARKNGSD
ncbi:MAG TPA: class I SAM-dependent methyltransferase [Opitutaceae bacterium]|jgi:SAM-dependent methyltransferase|nr:class I SAM-dependent methyltransferase [Opitutaceae bacterium]